VTAHQAYLLFAAGALLVWFTAQELGWLWWLT